MRLDTSRRIISALPEVDERPVKTRRRATVDGWEKEEEDEERVAPATRSQLEQMHLVFRNTLVMRTQAFPQYAHFDADLDVIGANGLVPPAGLCEGASLKAAMRKVRELSLLWMREVRERVQSSPYPNPKKGKGKGNSKSKPSSHLLTACVRRPCTTDWRDPSAGLGASCWFPKPGAPPQCEPDNQSANKEKADTFSSSARWSSQTWPGWATQLAGRSWNAPKIQMGYHA